MLSEHHLIERREELLKIVSAWRRRVRSTAELCWLVDSGEITEEDLANGVTIARCPSCSLKVRVDMPLPSSSEVKGAGYPENGSTT